ncbi:hypothetical protein QJS10_CPA16g00207 [Acorus calamus]|uniref:Lipoxygenase domain-containing protein n=1 Tax=Acorus calamus TaxID=4465 RepID=A0AAV9CZH5_ACOCL|nr:hypothetical protein QJS10_CPA16g00207 [Acorus calamus]
MAVEDPSQPCGVRLVIKDYPYAADGLLVWSTIEDWVTVYVSRFYPTQTQWRQTPNSIHGGMHAAINFGQYPFGGYMPNRPTLMKKLIPKEDDNDYEAFMMNP